MLRLLNLRPPLPNPVKGDHVEVSEGLMSMACLMPDDPVPKAPLNHEA